MQMLRGRVNLEFAQGAALIATMIVTRFLCSVISESGELAAFSRKALMLAVVNHLFSSDGGREASAAQKIIKAAILTKEIVSIKNQFRSMTRHSKICIGPRLPLLDKF